MWMFQTIIYFLLFWMHPHCQQCHAVVWILNHLFTAIMMSAYSFSNFFKSCVDNLLSLFSLVTTAKLSKFHPSIYVYAYMSYIYIYELHPVSFTPMKYWCSLTNNLHSPWVSVVSESTWPVIHLLSSVNLLPKNSSSYMINHCWICLQNVNRLHRPLVGFGWLWLTFSKSLFPEMILPQKLCEQLELHSFYR